MASERTRVRRSPRRARYERSAINAIVDEALIAHVGFVGEGAQPYVIPMVIARDGDDLLIHGSSASRLIRTLASGADVCVSIIHLDGIVVYRSAFDSSMNYRSVVILGRARPIVDRARKLAALRTLVNHVLPGRWDEARAPTNNELKATVVLSLALGEASVKVRSGPPQDAHADLAFPVWAGEIPLRTVALDAVPDPLLTTDLPISVSVASFFHERVPHVRSLV